MALPVFIKRGDARSEVDDLLAGLQLSAEAAGLEKYLFITQANQTVVMVKAPDVPLAAVLRQRVGWLEPME
jgi:hypothetical protein